MEHRNLGRSGLIVSLVGLGCNNFGGRTDAENSRAVIHKALDLGITLFDTADVYGGRGASEEILGGALGDRRKDIVLATKFGYPMDGVATGASRRHIMSAVEASLRRLRTDWIDLYQYHLPDPRTPIEETLRALDDLVRQGKVRYIGCSNMPAWQVAGAQWAAKSGGLETFVSCQDEYNMLLRTPERELVPMMQHYGLGLLPYYPLGGGMLTGKYRRNAAAPAGTRFDTTKWIAERYATESNWAIVEQLEAFCSARGRSLLDLAFSWLAARPVVASVIAGATRPQQLEQNVAAAGWKLSAEELAEVDRLIAPAVS